MNSSNPEVQNINSVECFNQLSKISDSYLIDVRTKPEWEFTGIPDLSSINNKTVLISWLEYPEMKININFKTQIASMKIKKNDNVFLICRSGARSLYAAKHLASFGYVSCYNVSDGFEGSKDTLKQRSNINGWKFNKLPWKQ